MKSWWRELCFLSNVTLALLWLAHLLPWRIQVVLGQVLGAGLMRYGGGSSDSATQNLEICFPDKSPDERNILLRESYALMGRSILDSGMLWFGSRRRLKRILNVSGQPDLARHSEKPIMWLLPHFAGLEWVAPALGLNQIRPVANLYEPLSDPVLNRCLYRGRTRFGKCVLMPRQEGLMSLLSHVSEGAGLLHAPDVDFGADRGGVFAPFFGVPCYTLTSTSRIARMLDMIVQPVVVTLLPKGGGVNVHFGDPLPHFPSSRTWIDAVTLNQWLEAEIRKQPAHYLWMRPKRFRP